MLIICVQGVNNQNQNICHSHINQKREKEQSRTVFSFAVNQKPDETPFFEDEEKAEPNFQPFNPMLPKKRRLTKELFPEVLSKGKRFNSDHFLAYISHFNASGHSRFAFSVSKKVCKNAVDRNRLRRQGYSIVTKHIKEIPDGFFCVFMYKKGSHLALFSDLEKEVMYILLNKN